MTRLPILLLLGAMLPLAAGAQGRARTTPAPPSVPASMMPPAGKCRIWMDGVAPAQQPAPTDCQSALRHKPANGTVVFGPTDREADAKRFPERPAPVAKDSAARTAPQAARPSPPARTPPRSDSVRRPPPAPQRTDAASRPPDAKPVRTPEGVERPS